MGCLPYLDNYAGDTVYPSRDVNLVAVVRRSMVFERRITHVGS